MTGAPDHQLTLTKAIARKDAISLPVLDVGSDVGVAAALAVINIPGLMRAAPRNAFVGMVMAALRALPESQVADFLDKMDEAAFRDFTSTDAAQIRSEHIPPAASQLIALRDGDMEAARRLIPPIRDQILLHGLDPVKNFGVVQYFLASDMHRSSEEKARLLHLLDEWFPRINMNHLFRIFDPKNRLFIDRVLAQGSDGAYDTSPRALLHYYWVCVGHDRTRLPDIRQRIARHLAATKAPTGGADAEYRNSLEWIASGRIERLIASDHVGIPPRVGRLRVAICLSGQMRGYEEAAASWRDALSLDQVDYDIYLHTWEKIGRKELTPYHASRNFPEQFSAVFAAEWEKRKADFVSAYPALFRLFKGQEIIDREHISEVLSPAAIVVDSDDILPDFVPNVMRMHYKIQRCHELALRSGKTYDLFIRLRPDKKFENSGGIDWERIYAEVVSGGAIFTDMAPKFKMPHGLVTGDQFWIMDPVAAAVICQAWSLPATLVQPTLGNRLTFVELGRELRQHLSLSYLMHYCHRHAERFPYPIFLPNDGLIDPHWIPMTEVAAAIRLDAEGRMDATDRRLLTVAEEVVREQSL